MVTLPDQCCYFTLQNEMLTVYLAKQSAGKQLQPSNLPDLNQVNYSV